MTTGGCPALSGATQINTLRVECPRLAQVSLLNLAHSSQQPPKKSAVLLYLRVLFL